MDPFNQNIKGYQKTFWLRVTDMTVSYYSFYYVSYVSNQLYLLRIKQIKGGISYLIKTLTS